MGQTIFPVPAAGKTYTVQSFLSSGSLTIPSTGIGFIDVFVQAGGGGGGKSMSGSQWGSSGGAPGQWGYASKINCPAGTALTITIGAGGAGASTSANSDQNGSNGSSSTISGINGFFGTITCTGGRGGLGNVAGNGTIAHNAWGSATQTTDINTSVFSTFSTGPGTYSFSMSNGGGLGGYGQLTFDPNHRFANNGTGDGYPGRSFGVPPLITSTLASPAVGSSGTNSTTSGGSSSANTFWAGGGGNGGKGPSTVNGGVGAGGGGGGGGGSSSAGTPNGNGGAATVNSGSGGGGGGCGTSTLNTAGNGGAGGSGFVVIGYWS